MAELLAHLAEVEARGIHRIRACSSLYVYCVYELRFSEDEAFRRVAAARLVKRFPALLDALASGELHLTGLLMLGPHLTEANLTEVLARAKHRTKRELGRLVRVLDPLPSVPASIEPLGPAPARGIPADPTWEGFVQSFCPVRELAPGERPRDWVTSANGERPRDVCVDADGEPMTEGSHAVDSLGSERYKVQFTATAEYVQLVEEAKALLSHAVPRATLDEIHLRALRTLVAELRKKKYATADAPARQTPREVGETPTVASPGSRSASPKPSQPRQRRERERHIPAEVRRVVFDRDGQQCTYVDHAGRRCTETHRLEFHHVEPFARGGEHSAANLALRCAAHNALAAEEDFGREFIAARAGRGFSSRDA